MKKPSLIHITAIIMVGICLYNVVSQFSDIEEILLNYTKYSAHSLHYLIVIVISVCGVITGTGLYFYRNWSRLLIIFITPFFLLQSLIGLLFFPFSDKSYGRIILVELIIYALFVTWCLYYLNRSDVGEKFEQRNPDAEKDSINIKGNIIKKPRGIKVTSILLIVICGLQIILSIVAMPNWASFFSNVAALIFIIFLFLILPLLGFISGFGILSMKNWARIIAVIYSIATIFFIFDLMVFWHHKIEFGLTFSLLLPLWSYYYFTRPHIIILFSQTKH